MSITYGNTMKQNSNSFYLCSILYGAYVICANLCKHLGLLSSNMNKVSVITGLSMKLDRIRLKEAIVMWPDMHSFLELDKFEPISNS